MEPVPLIVSSRDVRRLEALLASPAGASSQTAELLEADSCAPMCANRATFRPKW